jgi:hypothetical protein
MTQHTPLTNALGDQCKHTLIFFRSSACKLCRSIGIRVEKVPERDCQICYCSARLALTTAFYVQERAQLESHLHLVDINTDGAQGFAPEVSFQGDHLMQPECAASDGRCTWTGWKPDVIAQLQLLWSPMFVLYHLRVALSQPIAAQCCYLCLVQMVQYDIHSVPCFVLLDPGGVLQHAVVVFCFHLCAANGGGLSSNTCTYLYADGQQAAHITTYQGPPCSCTCIKRVCQ